MATKVVRLVCYLLFRLLLPLALLIAAVVRYNGLSFLYAVFLLICPLLRSPTPTSIRGGTGIYLRIVWILGLLALLAHAVFHITLAAIAKEGKPYGSMFPNCSFNEKLARQIGVERLDGVPIVHIIRLVLPDVVVFVTGLLVYIICYKLLPLETSKSGELPTSVRTRRQRKLNIILQFFGEALVVLLLAASGIIVPTVISSIYFLAFICIATIWSLYGRLGRKFRCFRILLLIYSGAHLLVLHLYQFQFFQEAVDPETFIARLIGLTSVIDTNCDYPAQVFFHDVSQWAYFVNPAILLCLYYTLAFEIRWSYSSKEYVTDEPDGEPVKVRRRWRKPKDEREVEKDQDESQLEHLVQSEVRDYSSMEERRSETPTMLVTDDTDEEGDGQGLSKPKPKKKNAKRAAFVSVMVYIMRQSYVLSLIAMMAWSITFHSWLTFVLLLLACIIWMFPKSRHVCYVLSPFFLFYGICLLLIQFVFGMNLTELPTEVKGIKLADIGLKTFPHPCLQLALQVLYTLMFWLTLRQYIRERRHNRRGEGEKYAMEPVASPSSRKSIVEIFNFDVTDMVDGYDSNTMIWLGHYVWCLLCKYWIFVCAAMLLVISIQEVVVYRIIYMILFLYFVLSFQFMYRVWRVTMFAFWWVVIIYSMFVLIVLYTYQFEEFPGYWHNTTGWSYDTLADLGLEQFDTAGLFIKLLSPTSFLIIIIMQVHYFHTPFLKLSALDRFRLPREGPPTPSVPSPTQDTTDGGFTTDTDTEEPKKEKSWRATFGQNFRKIWRFAAGVWETVSWFLWRLGEIHIFKVVAFIIIMVAVYEVSAISAVYVILLSVLLPLTGCSFVLSHILQLWTAIVILAKMIYQLRLVDTSNWLSNCTDAEIQKVYPFNDTIDNAVWVGLEKTTDISYYLRNNIGILLILVLERIIICHQRQYYNKPGVVKPKTGIIFSNITRKEADDGLKSCVQYFLNYFFYKFGLEMCYIMTAITICVRVDVYSVLYAIFLGILLALSRHASAIVWPVWTMVLVILLPVQFLLCLGLPLFLCYEYPWSNIELLKKELEKWLYLPDYHTGKPEANKLVADFFQLLFVCLQWRVFRMESARGSGEPDGGSNGDIIPEVEAKTKIPVEDFTAEIKSYLDVIKNFVFTYMFWVTLAMVFIAGTTRINLFSMGYVIAVFCFMWFGQEFLIKPLRKLVRAWNFLLGYCFIVILLKAGLQLPGCVYIKTVVDKACWLVQLLGLTCLRPAENYPDTTAQCKVEDDNTGLAWDVVVFVFLLLQKRIYTSHYFRHVVADFQAQNRLASRGAELINKILIREVTKQKQEEIQLLEKIKAKMNTLKEKQRRLKQNYIEPEDHFAAIRSGDYYLFEESEDEGETEEGGVDIITFGMDEDKDEDAGLSPMELLSTAMTTDIDEAVKKSESFEEDHDKPRSPKPSSPRDETKTEIEMDEQKEGEEEEEEKDSVPGKVKRIALFILALLRSIADWLTSLFNKISRNYRLVAAKLKDDHSRVKQQIQSEQFVLTERELEESAPKAAEDQQDGEPAPSDLVEVTVEQVQPDATIPHVKSEGSLSTDMDKFDDEETKFEENQPRIYRLLVATYYVLIARSELVCYFLMILNHMLSASLLSLPLPIFVFLWGMLSVPRPTKTFWITVITYTEAVVVVKYLFQFGFFPWNGTVSEDPFWAPRIIGIEEKNSFAAMDLVLLLALFIHRTILKRYGLWRDAEVDVEEKKEETEAAPSSIEEPLAINDGDTGATDGADGQASGKVLASPESTTDLEEKFEEKQETEKKSVFSLILSPFTNFYKQLTCPDYNATTDVYAPMFACDFIGFLIVVFGYWAFGPSQGGTGGDVTSYITEDRVPVPFLIMLLIQFVFIVVDRALYLKKNVLGKFIFQIVLVIIVHVWMFFILPYSTNRSFFNNTPAQLWYFVKCVYFALSAYQIRSAYPTRILGNFLTKKYNYLNLFLFKGFLAIPFVLELRTLMDWIWTDTTMAIGSWLTMEDIYANIYVLKCWREAEKRYPTPRATPKAAVIKYGVGGLLLFVIIFIIWFPLVIFSFANTVYVANPPKECTVSLSMGGFQPLFTVSGQQNKIRAYSDGEYKQLRSNFDKDGAAVGFLSNYEAADVTEILLDGKSTSLWGISPPSRKSLIQALENNGTDVMMEFHVTFTRIPHSQAGETLSNQFNHKLTNRERWKTAELIQNPQKQQNDTVKIEDLFPKYMRLASKSTDPVSQLLQNGKSDYSNVAIQLQQSSNYSSIEEWWQVEDMDDKDSNPNRLIRIVTFNDRVAPAGLSLISGYGIIGLYVTFILLIGRMLRLSTTGQHTMITYQELPYVDNILRLCLDLYLVREMKEHRLEEDLYAKLIFIYRSSETRIKWTRMPMEQIIETKKRL